MEQIGKFLEENRMGAFATVENGKPRVRPWGFMMEKEGKFYFSTANTKDVFKQLQEVPYMEFTASSKEMVTIRLSGKVIFTNDLSVKQEVLDRNPMVKDIYKSADNPILEVFYIEHGEVITFDFSGQPPKKSNF